MQQLGLAEPTPRRGRRRGQPAIIHLPPLLPVVQVLSTRESPSPNESLCLALFMVLPSTRPFTYTFTYALSHPSLPLTPLPTFYPSPPPQPLIQVPSPPTSLLSPKPVVDTKIISLPCYSVTRMSPQESQSLRASTTTLISLVAR